MKAKNIFKLFAVALLASIATVSCSDFLDIEPIGIVIPSDDDDFRMLLTESYANFPEIRSTASVRGDEVAIQGFAISEVPIVDIFIWNDDFATQDPDGLKFPYADSYKVIFNANYIINNAFSTIDNTSTSLKQTVGESYLLRAYTYFNLVNTYADHYNKVNSDSQKGIPLVFNTDADQDYSINTINQVYTSIVSDIEKGIELLNIDEQEKGLNYRFSKISAYGFASRVAQYMGNWEVAQEYATKALAINDTLVNLNEGYEEPPFHYNSVENILALEQTLSEDIVFQLEPSVKLKESYNSSDFRPDLYFGFFGFEIGMRIENKVSMRISELYLILSEAAAQTGNQELAKEKLLTLIKNRVSESYFLEQETLIKGLEKDDLLNYIYEERFRELAMQGFRWYDLRRTTQPSFIHSYNGVDYVLEQNDPRYTVPIPQSAIQTNNLLID
ncbi:RagB/SusD family nutrient uptake outer membrane protein [Saccharicrinis aurantiacus]|uniref:RagB/SusD family nutrient uptake outer membrane protein n=1 Tax=Saccharicrinis aurantiacus TaxID=1849719 RepID=UPI000838EB4C|nr:RagB/SusD family nutrient uptake outer membrane protein [Saccharicrinis aurantiacus]